MTDWKDNLKVAAAFIREQQKNKKRERSKFEDMENFRGRKGFNDTGIAITEKSIKQQRKNKSNYNKTRYEGSRLNFINDARHEAARQRRLDNPEHKKRIDTMFKIADERIQSDDKQQRYQKSNYNKTRYEGSRLNFINDARAEAARQRRLDNPEHKKRIDTMFKIADERIQSDDKQQQYQVDLHRMRSRSSDTSFRYMKPRGYGTESVDDGSVEIDPYVVDAAGSSVIEQDPEFKDKVNESIYRLLKNKK